MASVMDARRQVEHFVDLTNRGILQPGYPPLAVVICPLALSVYICDTKETFSGGGMPSRLCCDVFYRPHLDVAHLGNTQSSMVLEHLVHLKATTEQIYQQFVKISDKFLFVGAATR
ncbi:hypothetical protein INR49_013599 [Caranx melampygus]|nr:hypothetical protein INR49_013599 [Caranx melampygus]